VTSTVWVPVQPLQKGAGSPMVIGGMATLDGVLDLDQQLLPATGVIDSIEYLRRFGKVNWNHGGAPGDLLGDITRAEIREDTRPEFAGRKGLWIEANLNPKVRAAREAYTFMKGGGQLGFSVQGVTLKLNKASLDGFPVEEIETAFVSQVALTPEPKNWGTFAEVLKSARGLAISKALTAGAGTDHAQFTGGRALTRESFSPAISADHLMSLARTFRAIHGAVPTGTAEFRKAMGAFASTWSLSHEQCKALDSYLQRRTTR
jgi:hypothetical protein